MRLATESIRLVSGMAEICPARSRVQSPPEAPIMSTPVLESLLEEGLVSSRRVNLCLTDDLRVPRFGSNSIKIKRSLVFYADEHDDQAKSADTSFDPGFGHRFCRHSSRSSSFTTAGDRYAYHKSDRSHMWQYCHRLRQRHKCALHHQECNHSIHHRQLEIHKHNNSLNLQRNHDNCDRQITRPCFRRPC